MELEVCKSSKWIENDQLKFCVEVSRWLNKGAKIKKPLCDGEETEYMTEQFFVNRVGK